MLQTGHQYHEHIYFLDIYHLDALFVIQNTIFVQVSW